MSAFMTKLSAFFAEKTLHTELYLQAPDIENVSAAAADIHRHTCILIRLNNRYYLCHPQRAECDPVPDGMAGFYILSNQPDTVLCLPPDAATGLTGEDILHTIKSSSEETGNPVLLAGKISFSQGRITHWLLSDEYNLRTELQLSLVKSPLINNVLPLHLIH